MDTKIDEVPMIKMEVGSGIKNKRHRNGGNRKSRCDLRKVLIGVVVIAVVAALAVVPLLRFTSLSRWNASLEEIRRHIVEMNINISNMLSGETQNVRIELPSTDSQVRLVGGATNSSGRVEVYYNETWGTICDDDWDLDDGEVVCRMLGFNHAISVSTTEGGSGCIWLDDIHCQGDEISLWNCTKSEWGAHDCSHDEDAGVVCTNYGSNESPCETAQMDEIPIVSTNRNEGVVEFILQGVGKKKVICDLATDGGNWTVFQRRIDGSVSFYRDWIDYKKGFGDPRGEYWLGLEAIHQLTRYGDHELRIDMIERNGSYVYAKYSSFRVGPSSDNYRLGVSGYSGNATDSFEKPPTQYAAHNQEFSTKDADHDQWATSNCAQDYKGGWWYNSCFSSNLNGRFDGQSYGMMWYDQGSNTTMTMVYTEMKFRMRH